jgi:hypothetical protein
MPKIVFPVKIELEVFGNSPPAKIKEFDLFDSQIITDFDAVLSNIISI